MVTDGPVYAGGIGAPDAAVPLIEINDLEIVFPLSYDLTITAKSKLTTMVKRWSRGQFGRRQVRKFEALKHVSMTAGKGDVIGIIGPNGCGKTTLLRAISGIYAPDHGTVVTRGQMSTLLSVGTGFANNLPGRTNIYMAGHLMGLSRAEIDDRFKDILTYSELEDYIDVPMKFYSTGMISRLGFAISTILDPEILLIDEVFSVGDLSFSKKSENTIQRMLEKAHCQLIVTHNLDFVRENCTRAIYLQNGRIEADGKPDEVVPVYEHWAESYVPSRVGSRFVIKEYE